MSFRVIAAVVLVLGWGQRGGGTAKFSPFLVSLSGEAALAQSDVDPAKMRGSLKKNAGVEVHVAEDLGWPGTQRSQHGPDFGFEVASSKRKNVSTSQAKRTKTRKEPKKEMPNDAEDPVRGLTSYYSRALSGYELDTLVRNDPANTNKPITDQQHKVLLGGVFGWGPIRANDLFFNLHYTYKQDWKTNAGQAAQFLDEWFGSPTAETFLFPTQDLLRTHELAMDMRYLHEHVQAGIFSRLSLGRVGSSLLGTEFEEGRTVVKSENFVPYASFRIGRYYRGQISLPFRTEINEDDRRLSNATYSFDSRGRGFLLSVNVNNGIFIPSINSLIFNDVFYNEFKYASIQNDRTQYGAAVSIDFPVIWRVRASPKIVYYLSDFVAERVRIEGFSRTPNNSEPSQEPILISRDDTYLGLGGGLYIDFTSSQRLAFSFTFNNTTSTIPEFNIIQELYTLNYTYSWPRTSLVQKRVGRFQENTYAEEF